MRLLSFILSTFENGLCGFISNTVDNVAVGLVHTLDSMVVGFIPSVVKVALWFYPQYSGQCERGVLSLQRTAWTFCWSSC